MSEARANTWPRIIAAAFALYTIWAGLMPSSLPTGVNGLITTVLLIAFALIHGSARYGWGGIAVFVVICLVISNAFENLSILTGFPFGHYYYTDALGPKIFLVPVLIGGAYMGAGYASWMVAHVLLLGQTGAVTGTSRWSVALVASILMVSWDLCFDPTASTIAQWWIWTDGGGYFGVPFQNFVGWFLTVFVFFAVFAFYQAAAFRQPARLPRSSWSWPIVIYFFLGIRYVLIYVAGGASTPVTDAVGQTWMTGAIATTAALVALFTMVAFSVLAWLRLYDEPSAS